MGEIEQSPGVRRIVGPTILLQSGNYFDMLDPEGSEFTIYDIAHGLSNVCRFAGQCSFFYSVAQHSVAVSRTVPPEYAYAALMHDAAEAFIGDVTKPLKDLLPEYRAIENRVEAAIFARFSVPTPLDPIVKRADVQMLATEQRHLMKNRDDWDYTRGYEPLDIEIPAMSPIVARMAFIDRYHEIVPPSPSAARSEG